MVLISDRKAVSQGGAQTAARTSRIDVLAAESGHAGSVIHLCVNGFGKRFDLELGVLKVFVFDDQALVDRADRQRAG